MTLKLKANTKNSEGDPTKAPLEGTFEAAVAGIEIARNDRGDYLRWRFTVPTGAQTRTIVGATPMHLDKGAKTRIWTEVILGRPINDDEEVDLEKLVGRVCKLVLSLNTLADGRVVSRIDRVQRRGGLVLSPGKPSDGDELVAEDGQSSF